MPEKMESNESMPMAEGQPELGTAAAPRSSLETIKGKSDTQNLVKIYRSRWAYGRPAEFLMDRVRVHCSYRTTKDKLGSSYVQKAVVDTPYDTIEPKHSVMVSMVLYRKIC